MKYTFYATFGHGQPGYPGYLEVTVDEANQVIAEREARRRVHEATSGKWCGLYKSLDVMHEGDKIFRGMA